MDDCPVPKYKPFGRKQSATGFRQFRGREDNHHLEGGNAIFCGLAGQSFATAPRLTQGEKTVCSAGIHEHAS